MKPFIVGGGSLLGVLSAGKLLCPQCGIRHADEEPCIVCGEPVCRYCARDLGELGHCCASHGNVGLALAREEAVETRMRARPRAGQRRSAAGEGGSAAAPAQGIATPYYRSKDEAERALRFLAAMKGACGLREVDFVRELGCGEGGARFDVWRAVGLIGEGEAAGEPADPLPWPRRLAAPPGRPPAARLLR